MGLAGARLQFVQVTGHILDQDSMERLQGTGYGQKVSNNTGVGFAVKLLQVFRQGQ